MAILTQFRHKFFNNDGTFASGGKVYTYEAGTSTPTATYTTAAGTVANSNPIILDSKGEADIWVVGQIKVNLLQSDDVQVTGWPVDNIGSGVTDNDATARWAGTAGGTANALTITPNPAISAYVIGQSFIFKSGASENTAATTIAVSGLAGIAVQVNGSACVGGEILANSYYQGVLNSLTTMQIGKLGEEKLSEILGYTTTATAAGTTTLTAASTVYQDFTGATTQTVVLPVVSTLRLGHTFIIDNDSTGALTVNSSGGNLVKTVPAGFFATFVCVAITGTGAASWSARMCLSDSGAEKYRWADGGGTADAITATYSPPLTTLVDGQLCYVRATAANATTTPTFAPDGLTARTIKKAGQQALDIGSIRADNHELNLRYNLADTSWELLNPYPAPISSGTVELADASTAGNVAATDQATYQAVKIGNLCYVTIVIININTTGLTAGNQVFIRNLPFTSATMTNGLQIVGGVDHTAVTVTDVLKGRIASATNYISMRDGSVAMTVSQITSPTGDLYLTFSYKTA